MYSAQTGRTPLSLLSLLLFTGIKSTRSYAIKFYLTNNNLWEDFQGSCCTSRVYWETKYVLMRIHNDACGTLFLNVCSNLSYDSVWKYKSMWFLSRLFMTFFGATLIVLLYVFGSVFSLEWSGTRVMTFNWMRPLSKSMSTVTPYEKLRIRGTRW